MEIFSEKKLVQGVGINDAPYIVKTRLGAGSGTWTCPYYEVWESMLLRTYDVKFKEKQKTYQDVTVCNEWLSFMNFREWMESQDWKTKELDKDILLKGNKIYSAETCIFVPREINMLFGDTSSFKGDLPRGVTYTDDGKRYRARINFGGNVRKLGVFASIEEAENAFLLERAIILMDLLPTGNKRLDSALIRECQEIIK